MRNSMILVSNMLSKLIDCLINSNILFPKQITILNKYLSHLLNKFSNSTQTDNIKYRVG